MKTRLMVKVSGFQGFAWFMMALVPMGSMKAATPDLNESSKTKVSVTQKDSGHRARNKENSKTSAPTKVGITRQDAKAKVAQLEKRVNQLRKDVQAVKTKKPSDEGGTGQASEGSPVRSLSDGAPIPQAILIATPEEARKDIPPEATTKSSPRASLPQESTFSENKAAPVTSHAPHAVPVSPAPSTCPMAEKANMPGFVISPFPPRKLIDATNMSAGTVVKDPDTGAIFRLPKDLVEVRVVVESP